MKKFLTVLLALSVVFTYTVSAAFADSVVLTDEQKFTAAVEDSQKAVSDAVDKYLQEKVTYNGSHNLATAYNVSDVDTYLTETQVEKAAIAFVSKWKTNIAAYARSLYADKEWSVNDSNSMTEFIKDGTSLGRIGTALFSEDLTKSTVYEIAVKENVATAEALIAGVDLTQFSGQDKVDAEAAVKSLETVLDANKTTYTRAANTALCSEIARFNLKDLVTDAAKEKSLADAKEAAKNYEYTYQGTTLAGVKPFAEEEKEAYRTYLEGIAKNLNNTPAEIAAAKATLAVLDSSVAELVRIGCEKIDAVEIEDGNLAAALTELEEAFRKARVSVFYDNGSANGQLAENIAKLEGRAFLTSYAKEYAQALKETFNPYTGEAVYNAATVDKGLAEVIAKINNLELTTAATVKSALDVIPTILEEMRDLYQYKLTAIDKLSESTYADSNWTDTYTDNLTAVKAIKKAYAKKIMDAADKDAVDALVVEAKAEMDKYLRAAEQKTVADYADAENIAKYNALFTDYAAGLAAKTPGVYDQTILDDAVAQAETVLKDAVMAQQKALTNAQVKAIMAENYNAALAKINAIKSTEEVTAIVDAIAKAIEKLDKVATLDNKAQYLAVQAMLEDARTVAGFDESKVLGLDGFKAHMTRIVGLEKAAAEKAVRELPTTIKVTDAAAIEAARAIVDAYDDAYGKYNEYGYAEILNLKTLEDAEIALSNAQKAEVAKLIAALPNTVTLADKAAVEAARAAYDALTADQKKMINPRLVEKLESCEAQLVALDIKAVESMKVVKAHSAAGKGYIKVMWNVVGDETAIDGFQVYKSTKAQTGYTFMGKTTKHYMTNKKGLKKGKRFYYKVRAYKVIDGTKYFSDWSNKANRIYK